MKFFRALTAISLTIILAGCTALPFTDEARARDLMNGTSQFYQTYANLQANGMQARARIHRPDPGTTSVEILSPESIAGLSYIFREGGVELNYKGLTFSLDTFSGANTLPIVRGVSALSALLLPEGERPLPTLQPDGLWLLRGQFAGEECLLFLDEGSGLPVKLLLPSSEVEITFENFVFLG